MGLGFFDDSLQLLVRKVVEINGHRYALDGDRKQFRPSHAGEKVGLLRWMAHSAQNWSFQNSAASKIRDRLHIRIDLYIRDARKNPNTYMVHEAARTKVAPVDGAQTIHPFWGSDESLRGLAWPLNTVHMKMCGE